MIELGAGTRLADGRYLLERPLGAGGMASVWLAHDARLSRPVAVKLLADALITDPGYLKRFRREARLAAGLSHPNLVSVFDYASEDERPYLVMEFIAGPTLAERLRLGEAHELDATALAHQLLAALEHIHRAGIVHRDIKPSNVLLGPEERARLTDFGIARPADATGLTATGEIMGTLRYLAPELLRGERASPASDLYGCGVVLRQLLNDRSPPGLAAVVDSMTADDPRARPASAGEAQAALDRPGRRSIRGTALAPPDRGQTGPTVVTPRMARAPVAGAAQRAGAVPGTGTAPRTSRSAVVSPARASAVRTPAARRAGVATLVVAIAVIAVVVVIAAGSGRHASPSRSSTPPAMPAPAPASAPLGAQLDALARTAKSLARH